MFLILQYGPRVALGRRRHLSRLTIWVALLAVPVTMAACSGSPSGSPSSATRPAATSTTQAPTGASAQALTAYRAMWSDMVAASQTSDYQSPLLSEHATGSALSVLVQGLAKNQALGIVTKGKPVLHPQVTSLTPAANPTQATITDCFDSRHWLDYKTTGGLTNNTPGGQHSTAAIVTDAGGSWKVTQLAVQAAGTC
jgi:hypothetical protein